jgi:hypothetical protein
MKKILLLTLLVISSSKAWSRSGTTIGNAGDLLSKEFFFLAREMSNSISNIEFKSYDNTIDEKINSLLPSLDLKIGKNLQLDSQPVTAINYPKERIIIIDKEKWTLINKRSDKRQLVLHELLWLIGINDFDYKHSEYIFNKVKIYEVKFSESSISNALTASVCEGIFRGDSFTVFESLKLGANPTRHCPEKAFNGDYIPSKLSINGPLNLVVEMFNSRRYEYQNREDKLFSYFLALMDRFPDFSKRSAKNLLNEIRVSNMKEVLKFKLIGILIDYEYPLDDIQELLLNAFPHKPNLIKFWPPLELFIKLTKKGINWNKSTEYGRSIGRKLSIPAILLKRRSSDFISYFYANNLLDWCYFGTYQNSMGLVDDYALNFASRKNREFLASKGILSCGTND